MKIKNYLSEGKSEGVSVLDYSENEEKTLYDISEEFIKRKGDIFVFLKDKKVRYILTHTDLIEIMLNHEENLSLKELVIKYPKEIIALNENDAIIEAYNAMRRKEIEHLIVLDKEGNFKSTLNYKYLALYLTNIALKDELTTLYNRRFLDFIVDKYKNSEIEIGIIFIDCDNFKGINDTYGHKEGDNLLQTVSQTIKHSIREIDYPFRYGGDEFVIFVFINYEITQKIAKRILNKLKEKNISVSVGAAHYPTCGEKLEDVILQADEAMYKAKETKGSMEVC